MSVLWTSSEVPGLLLSTPFTAHDSRGNFTKVLSGSLGDQPPFKLDEVFWSHSGQGVIRGMHVQVPPKDGRKIIFLTAGEVRDFILDLRLGSPWFGRLWETALAAGSGALVIPSGCAHGFESLTNDACMVYLQEGQYDASQDIGVRWDSVGIKPRSANPIVSQRDQSLPEMANFSSPFIWGES